MVDDPDPPSNQASQAITESMMIVALHRRHDGWFADRPRVFLNPLANGGSISIAVDAADITPRSAYRLRKHSKSEAIARLGRGPDARRRTADDRGVRTRHRGHAAPDLARGADRRRTGDPVGPHADGPAGHLDPAPFDPGGKMTARATAIIAMQADFAPAMTGLADTDVDADLPDVDDDRPHPPAQQRA
ncbi:hypothetical protein [Sphingomonas ginsenosidivorax]|uniref:hypothetical protein n=1 Tax=Sphingomonas ginsenosidivorax TaxID=862135 RepID=UPI001F55797F|nr:hypothetical protein [Sphingomonas ginsenosidivorax]